MCKGFKHDLKKMSIIRNFYDKSARIDDSSLVHFASNPNLETLELAYSRKFDGDVANNLATYAK